MQLLNRPSGTDLHNLAHLASGYARISHRYVMEFEFEPTSAGDTNVTSLAEREYEEIESSNIISAAAVPRASGSYTPSSSQAANSQTSIPRVSCFACWDWVKIDGVSDSDISKYMNTLFVAQTDVLKIPPN